MSSEKLRLVDGRDVVTKALAAAGYTVKNNCISRRVMQKVGQDFAEVEKQIANCYLRVVSEVTFDDGLTQLKRFTVAGVLTDGRLLPEAQVPADQFAAMNWPVKCYGLSVNIEPGQGNRDYLRHALQVTAQNVPARIVYSHLGWRKIGRTWFFLHSGMFGEIEVDVTEENLSRYILQPANPSMMKTAVQLLDVAPREITFPMMALMFLGPLCEPLRMAGVEPAFVLWLAGSTGTMKSTTSALFLSFFGRFDSRSLPGNFRDTANSLEKRAFAAKDVVFVIDDYHPCSSDAEARAMQQTAQRILRSYGDRQGRSRLNSDLTAKPAYIPRGLALVTGESLPDVGQSGSARYFALELKKSDVKQEMLTILQSKTDELAAAMAGYTDWLAPQLDSLAAGFRQEFQKLRALACSDGHGRIPETVAWLQIGFSAFVRFAVDSGVVSSEEGEQLSGECWTILNKLAADQSRVVAEDRPANKFLDALRDMLTARVVWVRHTSEMDSASRDGAFIGWEDSESYFLIPGETYRQVCRFVQAQGGRFPVGERRLWAHLAAEGLIETFVDGSRVNNTILRTINGERRRVLCLKRSAVEL